jgi:hypothetical protein
MKIYAPISVRESVEQCDDLSNMLSVLMIPLPTGVADPVKRVRHIGTHVRRSPQGLCCPQPRIHTPPCLLSI